MDWSQYWWHSPRWRQASAIGHSAAKSGVEKDNKDSKDEKGSRPASAGLSVKGKTQEITVEEWRDGYFVVQPNMWTWLVQEKLLPSVVVHRDWEVVEPVEMGAETVTVREPKVVAPEYVMERKR